MAEVSSYIHLLRIRYLRMRRILTGNSNQSSKAISFFQPSYMPYQESSSNTFGHQASNQFVKDVQPREQRTEKAASDSVAIQTTQLLPRMPQYPMLPSPEYNIGLQVLLPKIPQYQRLPLPESNIRNQTQMGENNIILSLETSHQRGSARPAQKGISLRNQKKAERKGGNTEGPILTAQAARILRPTTPPDQGLSSLKSKEHDKAVAASEDMNAIRALCAKYHKNDVYNMDETSLSWEHVLYPALAPGSAKDGSHMTLALCVNSTGSDRLPVWVITSERRPISIDRLNLRAFGGVWQSSKNLAMTADAMREWLRSFYSHIGKRRSIILLLDNLIAHKKGVESRPPPSNIRIQWLPPGTTSRYQPLDQGINRALKSHYRQIWIKHMFGKLYGGDCMNPVHGMSPELAVRWVDQIWKHHIPSETIHDCFRQSSIFQQPQPPYTTFKGVPAPVSLQSGFVVLSKNT